MKVMYKMCLIILFLIIILIYCGNKIYAINTNNYKPAEIEENSYQSVQEPVKAAIKILRIVAIVVAAVGISLLGFKYLMGSNGEKAQYKETLMPFIFGAVFVFSVSFILQMIIKINQ